MQSTWGTETVTPSQNLIINGDEEWTHLKAPQLIFRNQIEFAKVLSSHVYNQEYHFLNH